MTEVKDVPEKEIPEKTVRKAAVRRDSKPLIALSVAVGGLLLWNAWLTRQTFDLQASDAPFVKVQLQGLIGEYIQAQARSSAPPERVMAETNAFTKILDETVQAYGKSGKIVMVSEAVADGPIPDVTDEVRKAVYSKIALPQAQAGNPVEDKMRAYLAQNGVNGGGAR